MDDLDQWTVFELITFLKGIRSMRGWEDRTGDVMWVDAINKELRGRRMICTSMKNNALLHCQPSKEDSNLCFIHQGVFKEDNTVVTTKLPLASGVVMHYYIDKKSPGWHSGWDYEQAGRNFGLLLAVEACPYFMNELTKSYSTPPKSNEKDAIVTDLKNLYAFVHNVAAKAMLSDLIDKWEKKK